ncbi:ribosome hibernation-promoting factor, HPF/YfiA family [Novosphingobium aerophilum]|uniref:ribosome hibernation-promoting factor, HPF/YfiA family n=1 Tax=Novosphingobium TaxID=165696 RepID=UPI0006C87096|nr:MULTISPECIES: ribosome-associated translation inhibitor RaiA [unclassified Novosphingobium]KPH57452.1 30S ribosomal protein S30 [Novosphingobium sp. ST904]MPS67457.1 ribosome-associated translation inhibitor RaiA [Novosphingobium sp.]TCM42993.1 ribosomal subunit interface protein [Novosphingobium sp. ST904]WRT93274.1 ribosome-associated translation inhibitor RaiA [Novosphingobium sp. RL4]
MDIRVSGHQVDTGEALQIHTEERLTAIIDKYFNRALSSQVTFGRAPAGSFRCDIIMHVMQNLVLKGTGLAQDAHLSFDQAAEKIDKQLRRYKRRLKDRHEQIAHAVAIEEAAYTIFEEPTVEVEDDFDADAPVVIAETRVDVPEATVSDAVMMLDLRNTTALLFKNAGTGRHNMVYRRGDGSIGWVEPH